MLIGKGVYKYYVINYCPTPDPPNPAHADQPDYHRVYSKLKESNNKITFSNGSHKLGRWQKYASNWSTDLGPSSVVMVKNIVK